MPISAADQLVFTESAAAPTPCREASPTPSRVGGFVRRRGSIQQGRALESLGHAVEYLVDSRMFSLDGRDARDEQEAIQILMRMSRAVFAECPEVVSLRRRLGRWVQERLVRNPELSTSGR